MLSLRDRERLVGVHPRLVEIVDTIFEVMQLLGYPMFVTDGVRTLQRQQELWAQGRSRPGKIVTDADGIKIRSNHQPHSDGLGHAIDAAFIAKDPWAATHPWRTYEALAVMLGAEAGGDWKKPDRPHIQYIG